MVSRIYPTYPLNHIWCPVVDTTFPTAESWHRVIVVVQSPVDKVGRRGHGDVDSVRIMLLGIRSIGIPCTVVFEKTGIWEVVDGEDGAILLDLVAGVVVIRMIQMVCISLVRVLLSRENDRKSDDDGH